MKKAHYLEGVTHEGTLDGRKVLTTWTTKRGDANRKAEGFRAEGALFTRVVFGGGRGVFRIGRRAYVRTLEIAKEVA